MILQALPTFKPPKLRPSNLTRSLCGIRSQGRHLKPRSAPTENQLSENHGTTIGSIRIYYYIIYIIYIYMLYHVPTNQSIKKNQPNLGKCIMMYHGNQQLGPRKWMVGKQFFPFKVWPIFRGETAKLLSFLF